MRHRLCGLSTYGLNGFEREMSRLYLTLPPPPVVKIPVVTTKVKNRVRWSGASPIRYLYRERTVIESYRIVTLVGHRDSLKETRGFARILHKICQTSAHSLRNAGRVYVSNGLQSQQLEGVWRHKRWTYCWFSAYYYNHHHRHLCRRHHPVYYLFQEHKHLKYRRR